MKQFGICDISIKNIVLILLNFYLLSVLVEGCKQSSPISLPESSKLSNNVDTYYCAQTQLSACLSKNASKNWFGQMNTDDPASTCMLDRNNCVSTQIKNDGSYDVTCSKSVITKCIINNNSDPSTCPDSCAGAAKSTPPDTTSSDTNQTTPNFNVTPNSNGKVMCSPTALINCAAQNMSSSDAVDCINSSCGNNADGASNSCALMGLYGCFINGGSKGCINSDTYCD